MARPCARCGKHTLPDNKRQRTDTAYADRMRGRGMCTNCYANEEYHGRLTDWPRVTRSRDELLDDYVILRRQGYDGKQCADRLGMKYPTFERAILRARAAGDPRARRLNERKLTCAEQQQ